MAFKLHRLWAGKGHFIAFLGLSEKPDLKKKSLKPFLAVINYLKWLPEGQHSAEGLLSRSFSPRVFTLPSLYFFCPKHLLFISCVLQVVPAVSHISSSIFLQLPRWEKLSSFILL